MFTSTVCSYRGVEYEIQAVETWGLPEKSIKRTALPIYILGTYTIDCRTPCTSCTVSRCGCLEKQVDENYVLAEESVNNVRVEIAECINEDTCCFYYSNSVHNAVVSWAKSNKHLIDYLVEKED